MRHPLVTKIKGHAMNAARITIQIMMMVLVKKKKWYQVVVYQKNELENWVDLRETQLKELQLWLRSRNTDPSILSSLIKGIRFWFRDPYGDEPNHHCPDGHYVSSPVGTA